MAKPTKLERAGDRVARIQAMLRRAEEARAVLQFEAEAELEVHDANQRLAYLSGKVEELNRRELERDKGAKRASYDFCAVLSIVQQSILKQFNGC